MTEQQEKSAQLRGRIAGWLAVLGVLTLAADALKHPAYPRGFGFAVDTLLQALAIVTFALWWAIVRHPDALRRALRSKLFDMFRPLAGLLFLAAIAVLPWSYYTHRPAFQVLMIFVFLLGAAVIADLIWLYHAHPERLPQLWKLDDKTSKSGID
ncbi:MAG: hypothetical protein ACYDA9_10740 [Terriglobia bacterium]